MTGHLLPIPEESREPVVVDAVTDGEARNFPSSDSPLGPDVEAAAPGRHRQHRSPARPHALKVLYGDDEHSTILRTAEVAGLRPSSHEAAAALAMAEQVHSDRHQGQIDEPDGGDRRRHAALTPHHDRQLLAELVQAAVGVAPVRRQRQPDRRRAQQQRGGTGVP